MVVKESLIADPLQAGTDHFAIPIWCDLPDVETHVSNDDPTILSVDQKITANRQKVCDPASQLHRRLLSAASLSLDTCRNQTGRAWPESGGAFAISDHGQVGENAEGAGEDDDEARMVEGSFGAGEIEDVSDRVA